MKLSFYFLLSILLCLYFLIPSQAATTYDWNWRRGRVTYYGTDGWNIHKGGCNYGYLGRNEPIGWDIAALTDVHWEYPNSCGTCYEVKCDPSWMTDANGQWYDRTQSCRSSTNSVILRVTDVCPCTYPKNYASNRRWCCGDMDHMDISIWAFEKLAETRWGVIPIQYRPVPCDYKPSSVAPAISNPTPGDPVPSGWTVPIRDWSDAQYQHGRADITIAFNDSYFQQWYDASWNAQLQSLKSSATSGTLGTPAVCGTVKIGGAIAFKGWSGVFQNHVAVKFWMYVGYTGWEGQSNKAPDLWVSISGAKGGCTPVRIYNLGNPMYSQPTWVPYSSEYFWSWQAYLPIFGGADPKTIINNPASFKGCGGNSVYDLTTIEFRNDGWSDQWVCLDKIMII